MDSLVFAKEFCMESDARLVSRKTKRHREDRRVTVVKLTTQRAAREKREALERERRGLKAKHFRSRNSRRSSDDWSVSDGSSF